MLATLQRIKTRSEATAHILPHPKAHTSANIHHAPVWQDLALPAPTSLKPRLVAAGLDDTSAERVSAAVIRASLLFKQTCEADFKRRCQSLNPGIISPKFAVTLPSASRIIYTKSLEDLSGRVLQSILPRISEARQQRQRSQASRSATVSATPKLPFNQNAVPILDRFFAKNAFPTRLEKYELASACAMEFRQIHVWFQNRRSRSRKEGKSLKTRAQSDVLRQLEDSIVDVLLPPEPCEYSRQPTQDDEETAELADDLPKFMLVAPAHAFPSPYPPVCVYDPFPPSQSRPPFPVPWIRSVSGESRSLNFTPDISELTAAMSKLSLSDASQPRVAAVGPRRLSNIRCSSSWPWFTMRCPRAPLLALITDPPRHQSTPPATVSSRSEPAQEPSEAQDISYDSSLPKGSRSRRTLPRNGQTRTGGVLEYLSTSARNLFPPSRRTLPRRMPQHPFRRSVGFNPSHPTSRRGTSASSMISVGSGSTGSVSDVETPPTTPPCAAISLPQILDPFAFDDLLHPALSVGSFDFADMQGWAARPSSSNILSTKTTSITSTPHGPDLHLDFS